MTASSSHTVTQLLRAWRQGDAAALDQLVPVVYEADMRLMDCEQVNWKDRAHFFAISARMMRRVLVEFARARQYQKRGAGARKTSLDEGVIASPQRGQDLVALDDALQALAAEYPRQAQVVELRFFGGLSVEETAEVLHVSAITVMRDWQLAKVWLARELKKRDSNVPGT